MPLPAFVRLPADVIAAPIPVTSNPAPETPVTTGAADVPADPERQTTSSISSLHAPEAAADAAENGRRPPPIAAEAQQDPPSTPLSVNQMTTEESRLPMVTSSSTMFAAPHWLTDVPERANQSLDPTMHTIEGEAPSPGRSTLGQSSDGPIMQTLSYDLSPSPEGASGLSVQPPARPMSPVATPPPRTMEAIPSTPRPMGPPPAASHGGSKPNPRLGATPLPAGADHSKQTKKPAPPKSQSSVQARRPPMESVDLSSERQP
jgi:hypothetical protein